MNLKRDDKVYVVSYNPPLEGRVADTYTVPTRNIQDQRLITRYPNGVPMVEVILESNGRLQAFVEDMIRKG
jgi:hypothetical protein